MKIAIITDRIYPYYFGGYERRAWLFASELAKEHEVHVFTSCDKNEVINGVHMVKVAKRWNYFNSGEYRILYKNVLFALFLLRKIFVGRYDVIDCNATPFFHIPVAKLMSIITGARFFITVHEALADEFVKYGRERRFPLIYFLAYLMKKFYFLTHHMGYKLIAVSTNTFKSLKDREGFARVELVPNGLSDDTFRTQARKQHDAFNICYVGRIAPNKNLGVLVAAFNIYCDINPKATLHFIGNGSIRDQLQKRTKTRKVYFHGSVDESAKSRLFNEMDCFVLPSLREGFSISTLEAMASRVPVIVAYNPTVFLSGVAEFTKNGINALYFDGTTKDLIRKIGIVCDKSMETEKRVHNAYETARQYRVSRLIKKLLHIYEK